MRTDDARLQQNCAYTFHRFSLQQLYTVTRQLSYELAFRELDCAPEADALCAALLAHARLEHAAIYSADCTP